LRTVLTLLIEFHSFITPKSQNYGKYEIIRTHNISTLHAEVCAMLFHHSHQHTCQTFALLPFAQSCRPQLCKFYFIIFFFLVLMLILLSWTKFLQNIYHREIASYKFLSGTYSRKYNTQHNEISTSIQYAPTKRKTALVYMNQ